jgi:hypothetical protein
MTAVIDRNILILSGGFNPSDTIYVTDIATAITQGLKGVLLGIAEYSITADVTVNNDVILEGKGKGSVLKVNHLASNYAIGYRGSTAKSKLVIKDLVIDGNKTLGTFTGAGHGFDILNFDEVYIDNLEVKNAYQHGARIQDCNKVHIGTLIVHDNNKFGVTFETTILAEELSIGKIIAYSNGWTGVAFGDTTDSIGWKNITIGEIISHNNGTGTANGEDGVAFGRNATGGNTGAQKIVFGSILTYNNADHGVEFFGSRYITGGSIQSFSNTRHGIYFAAGDDGNTLPRDIQVDSIQSYLNSQHGIYFSYGRNIQIGKIETFNNSQEGVGLYDGVSYYPGTAGTDDVRNGYIHIDSVISYDDQGTATQRYGLNYQTGSIPLGHNRIGSFVGYGNATKDLYVVSNDRREIEFGKIDAVTRYPSFADNIDGAAIWYARTKENDWWLGRARTTDGVIHSLVKIYLPDDSFGFLDLEVVAKEDGTAGGERAAYQRKAIVSRVSGTTGVAGLADVFTSEATASMDITVVAGGAATDFVTVRGTGVTANTIDWEVKAKLTLLP